MKRTCELTVVLGPPQPEMCWSETHNRSGMFPCGVCGESLPATCRKCRWTGPRRDEMNRDRPRWPRSLPQEDDDVLELSLGAKAIKPSLDPKEDVYLGPRFKTTILPVIWWPETRPSKEPQICTWRLGPRCRMYRLLTLAKTQQCYFVFVCLCCLQSSRQWPQLQARSRARLNFWN